MATNNADQQSLTAEQQKQIQALKDAWNTAYAAGDQAGMDKAHADAEAIRASAGYSGGSSGSEFVPLSNQTGNSQTGAGQNTSVAVSTQSAAGSGGHELSQQDRTSLTEEQQQQIQVLKDAWNAAFSANDQAGMDDAHAKAEEIRRLAGYSGGNDGGTAQFRAAGVGVPAYAAATGGKTADEVAAWIEDYKAANQSYNPGKGFTTWDNGYSVAMNLRSMANYIRQQMQANSEAWSTADAETKAYLHDQNLQLSKLLEQTNGGASSEYDETTGQWSTDNANLGYGVNTGQYNDPSWYKYFGMTDEQMEAYRNDTDRYSNFVDQRILRNLVNEDSGYTGIYAPYVNGPLLRHLGPLGMGGTVALDNPEFDAIGDGFMDDKEYAVTLDAEGNVVPHDPYLKDLDYVSDYTRQFSPAVDQYGIIRAGVNSAKDSAAGGGNGSWANEVYETGYVYDPVTKTGYYEDGYSANPLAKGSTTLGSTSTREDASGNAGNTGTTLQSASPAQGSGSTVRQTLPDDFYAEESEAATQLPAANIPLEGSLGDSYSSILQTVDWPTLDEADSVEDYLKLMYAAQMQSQIAALEAAYKQNVSDLDASGVETDAAYDEQKRQTTGTAAQQAASFREIANANGLNSGAFGQAALAQNNQLQSDLNTLSSAQAAAKTEIERQRTLLGQQYQLAILQAQSDNNFELAQALYQEAVRQEEALQAQEQFEASLAADQFSQLLSLASGGSGSSSGSGNSSSGSGSSGSSLIYSSDASDDSDDSSSASGSNSSDLYSGSNAAGLLDSFKQNTSTPYYLQVQQVKNALANGKITESEAGRIMNEIGGW